MLGTERQPLSDDVLATDKQIVRPGRASWGCISLLDSELEEDSVTVSPQVEKLKRRRSSSFIAVQSALFELNYISDFDVEKIAEGFFAEVYKATHIATGEVMVLKMNKQTENSKKMLDEIQLLNKLSHTNILKYKGCCVHEGSLHALTEYINGGSLEEVLQDSSVLLPWSMRANIAWDMAKGMTYLHSKGVFHRDLTSKNCLVQIFDGVYSRTVVADFGLAAKFRKPSGEYHNEVVGTPYWMAPECLFGRPYCEQADVFSFGIILAELATRLSADPDFLPRTKVFGVNFPDLRQMVPDCPLKFFNIMEKCCQLDPGLRPDFAKLNQWLESLHSEVTHSPRYLTLSSEVKTSCDEPISPGRCQSCPVLTLQDTSGLGSSYSLG